MSWKFQYPPEDGDDCEEATESEDKEEDEKVKPEKKREKKNKSAKEEEKKKKSAKEEEKKKKSVKEEAHGKNEEEPSLSELLDPQQQDLWSVCTFNCGEAKQQDFTSQRLEKEHIRVTLLPLIAKLCLKHEDSINILQVDRACCPRFTVCQSDGRNCKHRGRLTAQSAWSYSKVSFSNYRTAKALLEVESKTQMLIQYGWLTKLDSRKPA